MTHVRKQRQMNMAAFSIVSLALISTAFTAVLAARPKVTASVNELSVELRPPIVRWVATVTESIGRSTTTWTMHCDGDAGKDNLALWCSADSPDAHWSDARLTTHGADMSIAIGSDLRIDAAADDSGLHLTTNGLISNFALTTLGTLTTAPNRIPSGPGLAMIADGRIGFDGNFPQDRRGTHTMSLRIQHAPDAIDVRYAIGTLDTDGRRVVTSVRSGTVSLRPAQ